MTLTYGELFAGIGGFSLGFNRAGLQCAWQVEKDIHCLNLLRNRWPDVPKFGDIREVGADNLPWVDVICGGWPCQDLSNAGKRSGLTGKRSGLFFEMLRVIYELQPVYAVWENVPGLLSSCSCSRCNRHCARCKEIAGADDEICEVCGHAKFTGRVLPNHRGADFFTVVSAFGYIGYDGAWTLLDSQYFGVAQRRRRLFGVFARPDIGAEPCTEILSFATRMYWRPEKSEETKPEIAGSLTARFGRNGGSSNGDVESSRLIAFGGNNTKGPVSVATSCNAHPSKRYDFESETFVIGSLHNGTPGRDASDAADGKIIVFRPLAFSKTSNHYDESQQAFVMAFDHCLGGSERTYIHRKPGYAQLQANRPDSVLVAPTLSAEMFGAVRRLTPLECERLQNFPDGWTDGQSDSQRYHQLGNAVTVSVAEWLGRRIVKIAGEQYEAMA